LAGASWGWFDADLRFEGERDYELRQHAVVATFGRRFGWGLSLRLAAGAIVDGEMIGEGLEYDVEPGWTGAIALGKQWIGGPGELPFLTTTLQFGMSGARTRRGEDTNSLTTADLRLGVLGGVTLFDAWSPYAVVRGFGGPVRWRDMTGSDRHHYSIGVGSRIGLPGRIDLLVEGNFLGERSVSAGFTVSF
jgi:hypothetical protein